MFERNGSIWYARGVDEKADEYFFRAIRENNDFAQARNNLGVLRFKNGVFEEAAIMFADAIEIDPRYADARYNLALTHLRLGEQTRVQAEAELSSRIGDEKESRRAGGRRPKSRSQSLVRPGHASF